MKRLLKKLGVMIMLFVLISSQFVWAVEENIDVTATIQPQPSDVTISITADKVEGSEIAPQELVTFTLSYQVASYSAFPLEIVASWEQGLIEGTSTYVDVYDYVLGSASDDAYGTSPIVDLLNGTITWSIPGASYSPTPHEVTFQLQVKDSFLTTNRIIVYTNADATYGAAVAPQEEYILYVNPLLTVTPTPSPTLVPTDTPSPTPYAGTPTDAPTNTPTPTTPDAGTPTDGPTNTPTISPTPYAGTPTDAPTNTPYIPPPPTDTPADTPIPPTNTPTAIVFPTNTPTPVIIVGEGTNVPTPSPTSGPSPSQTPGPSPTPTPDISTVVPTPSVDKLKFEKVRIDDVGAEKVLISIFTNIDSHLEINYGLCSGDSFDQKIQSPETTRYHEIEFENLTPDTVYCFQITASNVLLGQEIIGDIFTFHTAREDIGVRIHATSTLWQNIRLNSRSVKNLGVPRDVPVVITLDIDNAEKLSHLDGEFVNRSVLGLTTIHSPNVQKVNFIEIAPGVFSAEIMTPYLVDQYYFNLKIKNDFGGYTTRVLPYSFQVADPIKVVDQNGKPIENAHLKIERFEESRKKFVVLNDAFPQSPLAKSFFQPYYSDEKGYVFVALPIGNYRITATAIGYEQLSQEFYLGDDFMKFPEISLRSHFSIATAIEYISFAALTAYEVLVGDISSYFSTSLLQVVLLLYEAFMLAFVILYGIEKFGILSKLHSKVGLLFAKFSDELFHSILGVWSISNVFITIFLILFRGFQQSMLFILITAIVALLDIYLYIVHEKSKKN